jgi:divalent metal cation (Fe/Co/Zn/Cd) transporter
VWTSAVVILGLICVQAGDALLPRLPALGFFRHADAVAALGVSILVIWTSLRLGRRTMDALLDRAPEGMEGRIAAAVVTVPGVRDCHQVRVRSSGPVLFVHLHVLVDGSQTLAQAHSVADEIESAIHQIAPGSDVRCTPSPANPGGDRAFSSPKRSPRGPR